MKQVMATACLLVATGLVFLLPVGDTDASGGDTVGDALQPACFTT